ncbi:MAG TPA: VWA domain-containing protein [Myxococcaceae bacterium]|nr:VWA domain-containing protein [Myxococcaceae bacterium]
MEHPPFLRSRRLLVALAAAAALSAGCDDAGGENGRQPAQPAVAPPLLSQVELLPPRVDRSTVNRVVTRSPPKTPFIQTDLLQQSQGRVDILWVIDDSGSMANQRQTLGSNFRRFFDRLVQLQVNFQIGVISTNSSDGGFIRGTTRIITNNTPNPEDVFIDNTTFPASRARWEMGLRMMQIALSPPVINNQNAGLLRPDAALAVIVVSDEDDGSIGEAGYYARFLRGAKGKGNESLASFSAIAGTLPFGCTPPGEEIYWGSEADPAFRYSEVQLQTGGIFGSICDATFENTLIQIAEALNTLRRTFPLSVDPDPSTIQVTVNGAVVPKDPFLGWQYQADTRTVTFLGTYIPPPGASIVIKYAVKTS